MHGRVSNNLDRDDVAPLNVETDKMLRDTMVALSAVMALLCATAIAQEEEEEENVFDADFGPSAIDVAGYPEEMQDLYPLYAKRCSKCHTLARSINSEYRGEDWDRYVARMSRKPNSGISPRTGEKLLSFLKFHFDQVDAEE